MTVAEAEAQRLYALKQLTKEPGIKSTIGKRRSLEQRYGETCIAARKVGAMMGYRCKKKYTIL